jgi:hypothetical protein
MRYSAGTVGLLTILKQVRLFGRIPLPALHMVFAYRPLRFGETLVQPIYVTGKRRGVKGWLTDQLLLGLTRRAFYLLRDEDGKVYDNMRFNPVSLLRIDRPVQEFIEAVDRLVPSRWSLQGVPERPEPSVGAQGGGCQPVAGAAGRPFAARG